MVAPSPAAAAAVRAAARAAVVTRMEAAARANEQLEWHKRSQSLADDSPRLSSLSGSASLLAPLPRVKRPSIRCAWPSRE